MGYAINDDGTINVRLRREQMEALLLLTHRRIKDLRLKPRLTEDETLELGNLLYSKEELLNAGT